LIAIGKIVRAHGIKGEVAVMPLTDFVDRFEDLESVILEGRATARFSIREVRFHKRQLLILFEGIDTRNLAEEHIGDFVSVTKDEMVDLPEQTFFQFDVIGMKVYTETGEYLGEIAEIIEMPANDLWRVEGERSILLPAAESVILNVDKEERKVTVRLLEGLLDL